jgi:hypothetical protein
MSDVEFDKRPYLGVIRGRGGQSEHLNATGRKLWLLWDIDHGQYGPDASLHYESDLLQLDAQAGFALFKVTVFVRDSEGRTVRQGVGHGSETRTDFSDFIEKAETKAFNRALAAIGYGNSAEDDEVIADTPRSGGNGGGNGGGQGHGQGGARPDAATAAPAPAPAGAAAPVSPDDRRGSAAGDGGAPIQPGQKQAIERLRGIAGLSDAQLAERVRAVGGTSVDSLSQDQAGRLIVGLQKPAEG